MSGPWGMKAKGSSISCPIADTGRSSSPGGQCNTEQVSQKGCGVAILVSLKTGARQTHRWPSLILVMTTVQQTGGQTGGPSEASSHKILDTAFIGHKGTCNYTAQELQGK